MAGTSIDRTEADFNGGHYVQVRGASLFYRELGAGADVVILHGGPGAQHDYLLPYYSRLGDEFHLFFYDQRGGGRSRVERPGAVSWRDHAADLEALRGIWGLRRPALLGYSWGGTLALLHATEYPDSVSALLLVAPAAPWGDYQRRLRDELARRAAAPEVERMRAELEASGLKQRDPAAYNQRRFDLSVAGYFHDPRQASDSAPFVVQLQAQQATWNSLAGHGAELRDKLRGLRIPTLILHGRHDPLPLEGAEELASLLPESRLVVLENSGHVPHAEEPEKTFEEIRRFLRARSSRGVGDD